MSKLIISLLVTVGASAWIYSKLQRSGGAANSRQALGGTIIIAIVLFIALMIITGLFLPS